MPAKTETHDLQTYMQQSDALLFVKGRIYFERGSRPGANKKGQTTTPPFGIVLCAYGETMKDVLLSSVIKGARMVVANKNPTPK